MHDLPAQTPPSPKTAARRLLVLLALSSHALRLMMLWDFVFQTAATMKSLTGQAPRWRSLGLRGQRLKLGTRWNWFWERRALREALRKLDLSCCLSSEEGEFLHLGLSAACRARACKFSWQIEAAGCIAWALRLLPRLWPLDEQFDGKLDFQLLAAPELGFAQNASLRPIEEIQAAAEQVKLWHWRARQLQLERKGYIWPPADATPEQIADLQRRGLHSLDGVVRATVRLVQNTCAVEIADEDFVAKGKPFRELSDEELHELLGIVWERHRALNWLCGFAPGNDWAAVPTET